MPTNTPLPPTPSGRPPDEVDVRSMPGISEVHFASRAATPGISEAVLGEVASLAQSQSAAGYARLTEFITSPLSTAEIKMIVIDEIGRHLAGEPLRHHVSAMEPESERVPGSLCTEVQRFLSALAEEGLQLSANQKLTFQETKLLERITGYLRGYYCPAAAMAVAQRLPELTDRAQICYTLRLLEKPGANLSEASDAISQAWPRQVFQESVSLYLNENRNGVEREALHSVARKEFRNPTTPSSLQLSKDVLFHSVPASEVAKFFRRDLDFTATLRTPEQYRIIQEFFEQNPELRTSRGPTYDVLKGASSLGDYVREIRDWAKGLWDGDYKRAVEARLCATIAAVTPNARTVSLLTRYLSYPGAIGEAATLALSGSSEIAKTRMVEWLARVPTTAHERDLKERTIWKLGSQTDPRLLHAALDGVIAGDAPTYVRVGRALRSALLVPGVEHPTFVARMCTILDAAPPNAPGVATVLTVAANPEILAMYPALGSAALRYFDRVPASVDAFALSSRRESITRILRS